MFLKGLTEEQQAAVHKAITLDGPLKVPAGAGSGKTHTLRVIAQTLHDAGLKVCYLAYNRSMADEAKPKFGDTAEVFTTHGLAYRVLSRELRGRKLGSIYHWHAAEALKIEETFYGLSKADYASSVLQTMNRFLISPDPLVTDAHLPDSVRRQKSASLSNVMVDHAQDLFIALAPGEKTDLPLPHDLYLKYWQVIGAPWLDEYDVILLDEAQDSNPVILEALKGRRVIYVGDSHQSIYGFRNAIDAMRDIQAPEAPLTLSFRFGPDVAKLANAILSRKTKTRLKHPLRGLPRLNTVVCADNLTPPYTRIYRTNYQLIRDAIILRDRGHSISLVGDMEEFARRIISTAALLEGDMRNVRDPLIRSFRKFEDLEDASERPGPLGRELRQVVRIVLEFKDRLNDIITLLRAKPGARNEIILTTAHKSKGLEWPQVALMSDFDQTLGVENDTSLPEMERDEELNLLYVAATRATERLSIRGEYLKSIAKDAGLIGPSA